MTGVTRYIGESRDVGARMGGGDHAKFVPAHEGRAFYLAADRYRNAVGFLGFLRTTIRRRGKAMNVIVGHRNRGGVDSSLHQRRGRISPTGQLNGPDAS